MTDDAPFDAGSVTDVRRARKDQSRKAVEVENAVRAMLSTKGSRALVWDYLSACHIFASSYSSESGAMYFAAGERNAGLRLFALIPEDLKATMAAEAQEN